MRCLRGRLQYVETLLCWIHTNLNYLLNQYDDGNITQYVVTSRVCTSSGSSIVPPSVTTASGLCATYQTNAGTQSLNGIPYPAIAMNDQAGCQAICTNNASCVAYETDTFDNPSYCWIHVNASDLINQYESSTVTQYVVSSRSCSSTITGWLSYLIMFLIFSL